VLGVGDVGDAQVDLAEVVDGDVRRLAMADFGGSVSLMLGVALLLMLLGRRR
jgi:uncharacterized protein (TIGR03382 family)